MFEDLINQQWQALKQLVRGSGLFGQPKIKALIERKKQRQKPSLVDTIGRRQKTDALDEYRRRFASATRVIAPVPPSAPVAPQTFGEPSQAPVEPFTPPPPPIAMAPPDGYVSGPPADYVSGPSAGYGSAPPSDYVGGPSAGYASAPAANFVSAPSFETLKARAPEEVQTPPPEYPVQQPGAAEPEPPAGNGRLPEAVQKAERQRRLKAANKGERRRSRPGWGSRLGHSLAEAMNSLPPSLAHDLRVLRQRKYELIAAAAACIAVFGGGYIYQGMHAGRGKPVNASHTAPAAARGPDMAAVQERPKPKKPAGPRKKAYYDRLLPETAETGTATATAAAEVTEASTPAAQVNTVPGSAQDSKPANVSAPEAPAAAPVVAATAVSASAPIEAPAKGAAKAPAVAPVAVAASVPVADKPTWVKAERYLPDGTRTDLSRPAAGPLPGEGEARKPVLAAVGPAPAMPGVASGTPESASATPANAPPPGSTPAQPAQVAVSGYFAQVKSDQNRSAAEAELSEVAEKYKNVLGETPLLIKSADLKHRGIWFRVLIGPVKSHDEAGNICKRLKGAGLQDCIVQKLD